MSSANSQNVVERVAQALKQQQPSIVLPEAVICAASEKYRLLAIQVRVGSIQLQPASQKDTSERRAAALLEYCARQHQPKDNGDGNRKNQGMSLQLPWPALASAVQTKSHQTIQQLQHILINFLQPTSLSRPVIRKRSNQDDASSQNNVGLESSRSLRQRMHSISYKEGSVVSSKQAASAQGSAFEVKYTPRILHELVIRLTGHLDDPHGIQTQTCQLLRDIYAYYESDNHYDAKVDDTDASRYSSSVERRGHLYDLQRYAAAYEAAALYHIATSSYQNNQDSTLEVKQIAKGSKGQRKEQARKGKDEALNHEDDDVVDINENDDEALHSSKNRKFPRGLQIDDLMDASNEYTYLEIMQVLPRVQALAKKLKGSDNTTLSNTRKRKHSSKPSSKVPTDQKRKLGGDASTTSTNMENEDSINKNEQECKQYSDSQPVTSFLMWKEGVLTAAVEQARHEALPMTISKEAAITIAANAILQKYAILPITIETQHNYSSL